MDKDFEPVILSACRTPIGAFGGALKDVSASELGALVIREAIARGGVPPADIGDVVMGCVLQAGQGMNVARQASLKAGLPVDVPAETVNRVCGSGYRQWCAMDALRAGYVSAPSPAASRCRRTLPAEGRAGAIMGNGRSSTRCRTKGTDLALATWESQRRVATRFTVSQADQDAFAARARRAPCAQSAGAFETGSSPCRCRSAKRPVMVVPNTRARATAETRRVEAGVRRRLVTAGSASGPARARRAVVPELGTRAWASRSRGSWHRR